MEAYLISAAIGAVIGAIVGAGGIVGTFDVRSRQKAAEEERSNEIWKTLVFLAMAENARLRVTIAAGEMTEDGKKIAAMTTAALGNVMSAAHEAIREGDSSPVLDRSCECDQVGGVDRQSDVTKPEQG